MEATIFDIKHYAIHDGPGIRQTIFFKGCPLNCWWCHNPESQSSEIEFFYKEQKLDGKQYKTKTNIGYRISEDELFNTILKDKVFFDESNGGVTFSGGEPLQQHQFLLSIAKKCKENSIHTSLDTAGFSPKNMIESISPFIDLFLYDLKLLDDDLHKKHTGVSVKNIINNLLYLDKQNLPTIIRFPLIPGITDTNKNLIQISEFMKKLNNIHKVDILPYHNISKSKYLRFGKEQKMGNKELDMDKIEIFKNEFARVGMQVKVGG